jgi:hypothetical protein
MMNCKRQNGDSYHLHPPVSNDTETKSMLHHLTVLENSIPFSQLDSVSWKADRLYNNG